VRGVAPVALAGLLVLGGATLVRAQQAGDPIGALLQPNGRSAPERPVAAERSSDEAPQAAPTPAPQQDAADVDAEPLPSAPAKPAPAKPVEPMKRPRFAVAVFQALDKVTAETVRFEAPLNHPVRYKTLIFTVNACETTAPDEDQSDAIAHVEIVSQPRTALQETAPARLVFRGWMFANAPGLHLFQHPVYDAWLIACKTASPPA
jgi:hypothetical protein